MEDVDKKFTELDTIYCRNNTTAYTWTAPTWTVFSNIPTTWRFLEFIVQDWKREKAPHQERIDASSTKEELLSNVYRAIMDFGDRFRYFVFSYAMFFYALDQAYRRCYSDLNSVNNATGLRLDHAHPPRPNPYVDKVLTIRHISIVHMAKPDDASDQGTLNWALATWWSPLSLVQSLDHKPDIENMAIFPGTLVVRNESGQALNKSTELTIRGILEIDRECMAYLNQFDSVCANYLFAIRARLPLTRDGRTYSPSKFS